MVISNITHNVNFFTGEHRYSIRYISSNVNILIGYVVFVTLVSLAFIFTSREYRRFEEISEHDLEKYNKIADTYKNSAYTHLFHMRDKNLFFNSAEDVMLLYRTYKHHVFVLGDPVGNEEHFYDAIDEMVMWASEQNMLVTFY